MIYIDCTSTNAINALTGIQRVVYNLVSQIQTNNEMSKTTRLTILSSKGFVPLESLRPHQYTVPATETTSQVDHLKMKYFDRFKLFLRKSPFVYKVAKKVFFTFKRVFAKGCSEEKVIHFTPNDTLLFLDATWSMPIWDEVKRAKEAGSKIIFVIYDLIPIRFSQFCDVDHREEFIEFIKHSLDYADGYIGISKSVMHDMQAYAKEINHPRADRITYDYFYLGANFSDENKEKSHMIRDEIVNFFNDDTPVFLTVSTIEPRKNHAIILDALDALWKQDKKVKLCFIGKVGWKIQDFMHRVKTHKELSKQFLVIHDATDAELCFAYKNAHSLIFASIAEGFGLPIIEALHYKLPVLASNIEVHREIGGDTIAYFESNSIASLLLCLEHTLENSLSCQQNNGWLTWAQSATMLWNKIKTPELKVT